MFHDSLCSYKGFITFLSCIIIIIIIIFYYPKKKTPNSLDSDWHTEYWVQPCYVNFPVP